MRISDKKQIFARFMIIIQEMHVEELFLNRNPIFLKIPSRPEPGLFLSKLKYIFNRFVAQLVKTRFDVCLRVFCIFLP